MKLGSGDARLDATDLKPDEGQAIGSVLPVGAQKCTGTGTHAALLDEPRAWLKVPPAGPLRTYVSQTVQSAVTLR